VVPEIGKKVGFLREQGTAIILEIRGKKVLVEDSDGFERELLLTELIELHDPSKAKAPELKSSEDANEKLKGVIPTRKEQKAKISKQHLGLIEWEIDLHIEELVDSIAGLSNTEIVLKQMSFFKNKFQLAKNQRVNKLVVIHGVGEGVLKNEIRSFLQKQQAIEFEDADFRKYGKGATLVVFHPNW
jgi:hypothetical protein